MEQCWACRQHKCNRCIGCACEHTKDQWVKPEPKENPVNAAMAAMANPDLAKAMAIAKGLAAATDLKEVEDDPDSRR